MLIMKTQFPTKSINLLKLNQDSCELSEFDACMVPSFLRVTTSFFHSLRQTIKRSCHPDVQSRKKA